MDDQLSPKGVDAPQDATISESSAEQVKTAKKPLFLRVLKWIGILFGIGILCIAVLVGGIVTGIIPLPFAVDCAWSGNAFAWIDENEDGMFQKGEPPLPGVVFHVNDTYNQYSDVGSGVSNWSGQTELSVFIPGCPETGFEVTADEPAGYRLTTSASYQSKANSGEAFQFGFAYLPGVPTVTPRPNPPQCTAIPEFEGHGISAIVSDKENLWVVANIVAKLNFSSNAWTFFDGKAYTGWPQNILISPDGSIWLIADQPNPKWSPQTAGKSDEPLSFSFIYQLVKGEWREFSPEVLYHKYIHSISWAPDGSMWFSTWGDGAFNWNPTTDQWSSVATLKFVHEILFAKDGKQFNIEELGGGAITPDGKVWGVSEQGFSNWHGHFYDPVTKQITKSAITDILEIDMDTICYSDMKFDSRGGMWLATCSDGLLYIPDPINGGKESWHEYRSDIGFPSNETLDLYLEKDSVLWIGTKEGLARCQVHTR